MPPTKYGKFVTREIIRESKYPQITTPIAKYDGCRGGGDALTCEWSCITKPFVMNDEPEVDNERDQFLLFIPSNIDDPKDFHGEIELALGKEGKKQVISEPTCVYLPRGTEHGAVNIKSVKKPIVFLSVYLSKEWSTTWDEKDYSKYVKKLSEVRPFIDPPKPGETPKIHIQASHPEPFRYANMAMGGKGLQYFLWSDVLGFPAKISWSYSIKYEREYFYMEPVHAHRKFHQICMYLGGNPLDIEDFDGEIDLWLGKEREKNTINSCAVDHMVPGLVHLGDEVRSVGKPFVDIMWVVGPNNYYKASATDKVLLSDESRGEVMIPEGAADYVPPTKLKDWVWPYPDKK